MALLDTLIKDLQCLKNKEKAKILSWYFKTGKGEYGEGDIFLGITVPVQRQVAAKYNGQTLYEIAKLFKSKIHEYRLTAIFILVNKYKKADAPGKEDIVDFYLISQ